MKRILTIFPFLFYFSLALQGQKYNYERGFVVTSERDTLKGIVNTKFNSHNKIKFKNNKKPKKTVTLEPVDVLEIHYGKQYVRTFKVRTKDKKGELIFAKQLLRGKINLYRGYAEELGKIFFISREGVEKPVAINKQEINKFFEGFFADCGTVNPKVAFNYKSIYKTILQYNECLYSEADIEILEELPDKIRFGLTADAGMVIQKFKFEGFHEKDEKATTSGFRASVGAILRMNKFFDIRVGVSYLNKDVIEEEFHYKRKINDSRDYYLYRSDITFKNRFLEIPVGFVGTIFRLQKNTLALSGGVNFMIPLEFSITNDFTLPYEMSRPSLPIIGYSEPILEEFSIFSYFGGVEYSHTLSKNNFITLGFRWSYDINKMTFGYDSPKIKGWDTQKTNRFDIRAGYIFIL